ncbi:unnamed protein product [Trifolium pratense]|uniref:Uncharacterized protein n=1 Tax=Trifolium pratense TaxID=57577 RepID=A0ACB0I6L2_TRIPR|nr:unnamed protein product [Trifolium pratense]
MVDVSFLLLDSFLLQDSRKVIEQSNFKQIFLKLVTQENTTVTDEGSTAGAG